MIVDLAAQPAGELPQADVVVGAGAVGLTLAVKLARAGRPVALLEAGPIELSTASQQYFESSQAVGVPHQGLHTGRFRMLGGTTNFWGGQVLPIGGHVFRSRAWLNRDTAWPVEPEELAPFITEAFELLGMSRQIPDDAEVLARLGVAMPALSDDLAYFFTRWVPEPVLPRHFAQDLHTSGRLVCYVNAQVSALDLVERSVAAVEVSDPTQRCFTVRGRQMVLANGTVEIARLLLSPLRNGQSAPWSGNPWLGRGFMDHLDVTAGRLELIDKRRFNDLFQNAVLDGIKYQPKIRLTAEAQERTASVDIAAHLLFNSTYAEHFANAKIFLRSFLKGRPDKEWRRYPSRLKVLLQVGVPLMLRYLRDNRIYAPTDGGIDLRLTCEQLMVPESGLVATDRTDRSGRRVYDLDWRVDGVEIETMARFAADVGRSLEAGDRSLADRPAAGSPRSGLRRRFQGHQPSDGDGPDGPNRGRRGRRHEPQDVRHRQSVRRRRRRLPVGRLSQPDAHRHCPGAEARGRPDRPRMTSRLAGMPRLGMGSAYLIGGLNRRVAARMVHVAFDHGVRYFDTAPLYGMGTAETTLAQALKDRRSEVIVATKVGLPFERASPLKLLARSAAAPIRARFPSLARAPTTSSSNIDDSARGRFDLPFVEASVARSMAQLGTERLDVLLLHEARLADLSDELLRYLERGKSSGRFGLIGVGTRRGDVEAITARHAGFFDIAQYSWSVLDPENPVNPHAITITHRTVMGVLAALRSRLADARRLDRASAETGMDLGDEAVLVRVLIGAALALNPKGLALVASRSVERLRSNLMTLADPTYEAAGLRLRRLLQAEVSERC